MVVKKRIDNPGETIVEHQTSLQNSNQEQLSTSKELQEANNENVLQLVVADVHDY